MACTSSLKWFSSGCHVANDPLCDPLACLNVTRAKGGGKRFIREALVNVLNTTY